MSSVEKTESSSVPVDSVTVKERAVIRGGVSYPWGTVRDAKVTAGEKTVTSDSAGKYEISALNPGVYNVEALAPFPGYEPQTQTVQVAAGETKVVDIFLDFKKTVVEGHVYDLEGKPVASATLSGVLSGKDMDTATTDERGYFKFARVTPGDRFIRVNAPGHVGETRDFTAKEKETTVLEFRLTPAALKVHGIVSDAAGKPLRAEVFLLKSGIVVQKTVSNAETGYFEFPVVAGRYEVTTVASGYVSKGWFGAISVDTRIDLSLGPEPQAESSQSGST